jgi:multiple sugar transport system substrate-binding protein
MSRTDGWEALTRRDFLGATVTFVGGVALAGCTSNPAGGGGGGTAKVTLQQWYHEYGEAGTLQAVLRYAAQYTKQNPSVAIQISWKPGDYQTALQAALLSDSGPDVYENNTLSVQMVKQHQAVPLDDLVTSVRGDFNQRSLASFTMNGKLYGIKDVDDTAMLYYRKSLLQRAGVEPPTTMEELLAATKKLTKGGVKGLFLGNDGGVGSMWYVMPWSNHVRYVENTKVVIATTQMADTISALRELNASNVLLQGFTTDWFDPGAFIQGAVAMQWAGLWAMPAIKKALADDFGVMPWPKFGSGGVPASFLGGWAQLVNGKGKHVKEAKDYVKWLWVDRKSLQQEFNLTYGFHVPPRKSIAAEATPLKSGTAKQGVDIVQKYGYVLPNIWDNAMGTFLTDAIGNVIKNNADPLSQLQSAQAQAQAELDKEQ